MKVLIVKTSSMGDVLHTLPALTDAVRYYPDIQFDWVIEENFAEIPYWHSAVKRVIPVAIRRWRKNWLAKSVRQQRAVFRAQLQQQKYDAVIDAQGLLKSAFLITRIARGVSHGYDWKSAREPLASLFYDYRYRVNKQQHAVERIRQLFAKSLHYNKPTIAGDYGIAPYFSPLALAKENAADIIFFHATTRDEKHWPESHWRQLITAIQAKGLTVKLPWATALEHQRALRLAAGFKHVEVLPKLSLNELAQQIVAAKAVVSVDTGLSHLTAALSKPNITLYGPTDPGLIGGYGEAQQAIISADGNMATIEPNDVYQQLILKIDNK
ncbi:lipopolysaccharide heptosyltransferase RfaC [Arsenophonus nasoniae]|uniref:Lipopolysaccharide heptosyltransferase 1 n=1 Tax=Arsenophonus nasoniae TaxID=638 RepID=A0AA95GG51_9GAMM|nr:lipopolysaccharide heptosyltransferase RfaC [Arsenophonus nasoniae]WGL95344.1 lipopolysaccharide heptosyltransferase RfaC [Arsenophonus nasoniae]WGM02117.1 lipopolysaccharide heptosyltransferase RfaC [Arsenophonus nasoniae]